MTNNIAFPQRFLSSLKDEIGFNEAGFINAHQENNSPVSIRTNPFKSYNVSNIDSIPWCKHGYYLTTRPSFTFDPAFHAGAYYVQEASSMFVDHIIRHIRSTETPVNILDLCAAPGGKSTLINSAINSEDLLVANEIIKTRVPVLVDNLTKWGTANSIVTNNDPKDFSRMKDFFDIVLVDAPCSGSGMFRKDTNAMNEWSEANVNLCHQRQERILADIYPAIKSDGYLIYSTCSYSHQENEDILDWLCENFELESVPIPINTEWGIVTTQSAKHSAEGYRFYPDKVRGEGFFVACLKKATTPNGEYTHRSHSQQKLLQKELDIVRTYIAGADNYYFFKANDEWMALPKNHKESLNALHKNLYIKKSGVRIGKLAGIDLIPDHELALSNIINKNQVPVVDVDIDDAINYLRKESIPLNTSIKGWAIIKYNGLALGWVKILPNRVNNYYPKELRILTRAPQ